MKTHLIPCIKITILTMILFGVVYPMLITGIARFTAPNSGEGATVELNGKVVGFAVIGQAFESDKYFHGRPSAVGYNSAVTGGSNKGPTNSEYLAQVDERINNFLTENPGIEKKDLPVDLVTASGSGLDPHISKQAALVQVPGVAKARNISEEKITGLVNDYTRKPLFGLIGTQTVHVLKLNIALDSLN